MPLILVKTTASKSLDVMIVHKVTEATMETLGVKADDVAIKFEKANRNILDLYLYDKKQYPYQQERTADVFERLKTKIEKIINE